ncbi:SRPBCC family protein [Saccharopolyspora spinosporotrichia]
MRQLSDTTVAWSAKIFLSRRSWEATIVEQVPDDHITWKIARAGTRVDGTVTFQEQAPGMTRVQLVLAYRPRGFLERTANLWRAQGRRVRSDFRHVKRHMMTRTILRPDRSGVARRDPRPRGRPDPRGGDPRGGDPRGDGARDSPALTRPGSRRAGSGPCPAIAAGGCRAGPTGHRPAGCGFGAHPPGSG